MSIQTVAAEIGIPAETLIPYGQHFAKIRITSPKPERGKLILVTAITPTSHGEGKTVTTIGLAQSIRRLGRTVIATLRQPSMGPVFGLKGGATGGGLSKLVPSELINLHFTGDFHAISSAHNLLSAMIDAHIFHGNPLRIASGEISWPRTLDVNDRALRRITVAEGKSNGTPHPGQFVITAASEVMAVFALATSYDDLRRRLSRIIIGFDSENQPVTAGQLQASGAMMVLLRDAFLPNLAQTADGTAAFVHAGPFANIAHGTASVSAQRLALQYADFVVNEAGFGADLGAEKYFDIVMPASGLQPAAAVVVATVRALSSQGEGDLQKGLANLARHLDIVQKFGVPAVVAMNQFPDDRESDLALIRNYCQSRGVACAPSEVFSRGAEGGMELAELAVAAAESGHAKPRSLYAPELPITAKIDRIAREIYGADGARLTEAATAKAERFTTLGFGKLPVCIAKTPLSFTEDANRRGAPIGWTLPITDLVLQSGAGFIVAPAGATMRMPGLGKEPQAIHMDLGPDGEILGIT
jgi:formate--tetrahydrofolate ligase